MQFPENLKYTKDHEWAQIEGQVITIGITDHAQQSLGDVVYVDLPKPERVLKAKEAFGVVESIKAVSDLYSPVAGKITEVNQALSDDPSLVNKDPHKAAWMIRIEVEGTPDLSHLMDQQEYEAHVQSLTV